MLIVEVRVNDLLISSAHIRNVSELADVSDYAYTAISRANPLTGAPKVETSGDIQAHDRLQSAWALIAKVAAEIAENETPQRGGKK